MLILAGAGIPLTTSTASAAPAASDPWNTTSGPLTGALVVTNGPDGTSGNITSCADVSQAVSNVDNNATGSGTYQLDSAYSYYTSAPFISAVNSDSVLSNGNAPSSGSSTQTAGGLTLTGSNGTVSVSVAAGSNIVVDYVWVHGGQTESTIYWGPTSGAFTQGNFRAVHGFSGYGVCYHVAPTTALSVSTTPSVNNAGLSATDTATVTATGGTPNGTVTFTLYDATTNTSTTQTGVALSGSSSPYTATSQSFTGLTAGDAYYFVATYVAGSGDVFATTPGQHEDFTIPLLTPTVITTANPSSSSATDTVTVSGPVGEPTPTGSVLFTLYNSSGSSEGTNNQALVGGTATSSAFSYAGLANGTYHFVAVYTPDSGTGGSAYYTSGSDGGTSTQSSEGESFSINTPPPPPPPSTPPTASLSTTPSVSGVSASDFATVSGTGNTPTGSVTFTLYQGDPKGTNSVVSSFGTGGSAKVDLSASGTATSPTASGLAAGNYYFMVTYSGDTTYSAITPGSPEPFFIAFQKALLGTTPTEKGLSATDAATVTGTSGTPTGSVTFTLFSGAPGSGTQVKSYAPDTVTLDANGQATSAPTGTLASGSYYFMVTYSGNGTYSAITPGTAETFTIIAVSPAKPPKKPKVPPYKIPTKPPTTGFGGSARMVYNGGLLAGGASVLLAGLLLMAYALRRRRRL